MWSDGGTNKATKPESRFHPVDIAGAAAAALWCRELVRKSAECRDRLHGEALRHDFGFPSLRADDRLTGVAHRIHCQSIRVGCGGASEKATVKPSASFSLIQALILELCDVNILEFHVFRAEDQVLHGEIGAVGEHRALSRDFRVD